MDRLRMLAQAGALAGLAASCGGGAPPVSRTPEHTTDAPAETSAPHTPLGNVAPPTTTGTPNVTSAPASAHDPCALVADPFVVGMDAGTLSQLEWKMAQDVAVVRYVCGSLKPMESCAVEGNYTFTPAPRKDVSLRFKGDDEAKTNLRGWGTVSPAKLEPDESAELIAVTVGERRVRLDRAKAKDLVGNCQGATHVVRAVTVGAFAFRTTAGQGKRRSERKAGELAECPSATSTSPPPASRCRAAVRLELIPIEF